MESKEPQNLSTQDYIDQIIEADPFNVYCVDCKMSIVSHASITYGIFLCDKCAMRHRAELGSEKSVIKAFTENWDEH